MTLQQPSRVACLALWTVVGLAAPATASQSQGFDLIQPSAEAVSAAVKSNQDLVKGLAKELQSTPEQAAEAAGAIFTIAKSLLPPDDFAQVAKAVPGMEALLAVAPKSADTTSVATPGFAAAGSSPAVLNAAPAGANSAGPGGIASAIGTLSKIGIKPDMLMKAVPFLSGYLKKHGSAAIGGLLGSVFKTGK